MIFLNEIKFGIFARSYLCFLRSLFSRTLKAHFYKTVFMMVGILWVANVNAYCSFAEIVVFDYYTKTELTGDIVIINEGDSEFLGIDYKCIGGNTPTYANEQILWSGGVSGYSAYRSANDNSATRFNGADKRFRSKKLFGVPHLDVEIAANWVTGTTNRGGNAARTIRIMNDIKTVVGTDVYWASQGQHPDSRDDAPVLLAAKEKYQPAFTLIFEDGTTLDVTKNVAWGSAYSLGSIPSSVSLQSEKGLNNTGEIDATSLAKNDTGNFVALYTYYPLNSAGDKLFHLQQALNSSAEYRFRSKFPLVPGAVEFNVPNVVLDNSPYATQLTAKLNWDDESFSDVSNSVSWVSNNTNVLTIKNNNYISTANIATQTNVAISGAFKLSQYDPEYYPDYSNPLQSGLIELSIRIPRELASIEIVGLSEVNEKSTTPYTVTAHFDDNTQVDNVLISVWAESSAFAAIDNRGILVTDAITQNKITTLNANYTYRGVTKTASLNVTINNSVRDLNSIAITGPSSVDELSSANYITTVTFDDGASEVVPVWRENSEYAFISSSGELRVDTVTRTQTIIVYASYSHNGMAVEAEYPVTINNSKKILSDVSVTGPSYITNTSGQYLAIAIFDDGTETIIPSWSIEQEDGSIAGFASINSSGLVTINSLDTNKGLFIKASYEHNGLSIVGRKLVSVLMQNGTPLVTRASTTSGGIEADHISRDAMISRDGRYVVFLSYANNLSGIDSPYQQIYLKDRQMNKTTLISKSATGAPADRGGEKPYISSDGRYVSFTSRANNLADVDTNFSPHIFVYDRESDELEVIVQGSSKASLSANGRYVVFESSSRSLIDDLSLTKPGTSNIYLFDRLKKTFSLISRGLYGAPARYNSDFSTISGDGRYVIFRSEANNLVLADNNDVRDIFMFDREHESLTRLSVAQDGTEANGGSYKPIINENASVIAFSSSATNLIENVFTEAGHIYVKNIGRNEIKNVTASLDDEVDHFSYAASMFNKTGEYLVLTAKTRIKITENSAKFWLDVYWVELINDGINSWELISANEFGSAVKGDAPSMTGDGSTIVFHSNASDLVDGDTNNSSDVFVRVRSEGLLKTDIWLDPESDDGVVGDKIAVNVFMNFSDYPTLGGAFNIGFDNTLLTFDSFVVNEGLGGDPELTHLPNGLSVELNGASFGKFEGMWGETQVGTAIFNIVNAGTATLTLTDNVEPYGGFFSLIGGISQAIDYTGATINLSLGADLDGDGVADVYDLCPDDATDWLDFDLDGLCDNADSDDDNDAISDVLEIQYGLNPFDHTDALADLDGDGASNLVEILLGTSPVNYSDYEPPSVPILTAIGISDEDIKLSWPASVDGGGSYVAGYKIFRDGAYLNSVSGVSYVDRLLIPSTEYNYVITAYDDKNPANESRSSNVASATTDVVHFSKILPAIMLILQ